MKKLMHSLIETIRAMEERAYIADQYIASIDSRLTDLEDAIDRLPNKLWQLEKE